MARGSKASYSSKQKRQASDIEKSYEKRGVSSNTAAARAWATVNKQTGGGKKSAAKKSSGSKTAKKSAGRKTAAKKSAGRKSAAKKTGGRKKTASRKSAAKKSSRSRR